MDETFALKLIFQQAIRWILRQRGQTCCAVNRRNASVISLWSTEFYPSKSWVHKVIRFIYCRFGENRAAVAVAPSL